MESKRKQRILTGLSLGTLFLVANFAAPSEVFFALFLAMFTWAAAELVRIWRHWAPAAPLEALPVLTPVAALGLAFLVRQEQAHVLLTLAVPAGLVLVAALIVLGSRAPLHEGAVAVAFLVFGTPYFAVPAACLYHLHRLDPWLVFVVVAIVGFGDTAAYFVGSWIGRHKVAPRVSPNKTWEGSIAGGLAAVATVTAWCLASGVELGPAWLLLAAVTEAAAQFGDLFESLIKRGAGVKDSSNILPGHGGIYDRVDAMLLATPVFVIGLWLLDLA